MNLENKDEYYLEKFKDLDYSGLEISGKEFDSCSFTGCNFSEVIFTKCKFIDCDFINCNLSIIKIKQSKFTDVCFRDSKLIGINWTEASWPALMFSSPIKFYNSILNDCSFFGLSLRELVLQECKANNADFREGDFSNSNFTHTDFTGCFFGNTNLSGADFSQATNYNIDVYQNIIKQTKFSRFEAIRLLDSLEIELVD